MNPDIVHINFICLIFNQRNKKGLNHHIRLRVVSFCDNESNRDVSQQFQLRDEYGRDMLCYIFELEEFKDRTHTGWQVQQSRLHVY